MLLFFAAPAHKYWKIACYKRTRKEEPPYTLCSTDTMDKPAERSAVGSHLADPAVNSPAEADPVAGSPEAGSPEAGSRLGAGRSRAGEPQRGLQERCRKGKG